MSTQNLHKNPPKHRTVDTKHNRVMFVYQKHSGVFVGMLTIKGHHSDLDKSLFFNTEEDPENFSQDLIQNLVDDITCRKRGDSICLHARAAAFFELTPEKIKILQNTKKDWF